MTRLVCKGRWFTTFTLDTIGSLQRSHEDPRFEQTLQKVSNTINISKVTRRAPEQLSDQLTKIDPLVRVFRDEVKREFASIPSKDIRQGKPISQRKTGPHH